MVLLSVDFSNLHTILESLYNEMMPLCGDILDVAKGLAGLGALFYVAVRVWELLARAEPIDVYPPVCDRHLHHAFPDSGTRNDEYGAESDCAGNPQDA